MTFKVGTFVRVKPLDSTWTAGCQDALSGREGRIVEHKPKNYLGNDREAPYLVDFGRNPTTSNAWWFAENELESVRAMSGDVRDASMLAMASEDFDRDDDRSDEP